MTVISKVKQTLAAIKGVRGTLDVYAAQTNDKETREVFSEAVHITEGVIKDLETRVQKLEFEEPQYKGY
ncbi:MAG: DUF1657 domain-containing protein [Clostridia bacterium]|jgi:bacterioferritin (cytochrome b1)|nr:DUF1657 domain-containing protein [Clostridia bacterium]